jgi:BolA protein
LNAAGSTRARIEACLAGLEPRDIELTDESGLHAGHEGAKGGGGHYNLTIVSERFAGLSPVERHRRVYEALGPLMHKEIHALAIRALTPDEL